MCISFSVGVCERAQCGVNVSTHSAKQALNRALLMLCAAYEPQTRTRSLFWQGDSCCDGRSFVTAHAQCRGLSWQVTDSWPSPDAVRNSSLFLKMLCYRRLKLIQYLYTVCNLMSIGVIHTMYKTAYRLYISYCSCNCCLFQGIISAFSLQILVCFYVSLHTFSNSKSEVQALFKPRKKTYVFRHCFPFLSFYYLFIYF